MTSNHGRFNDYIEPVFDHMGIFNPAHDSDNPIDFVWQGIVGGLTRMVRNQPKDRFGTKAPSCLFSLNVPVKAWMNAFRKTLKIVVMTAAFGLSKLPLRTCRKSTRKRRKSS
jgi:hypothetical protein